MSQRLWLIGIVADVAAVLAVLGGSAQSIAVVGGAVALLLGAVQLVTSVGKPVDRWVVLAIVGIVAGAVTITAVISGSLVDKSVHASGSTSGATTTLTSATAEPTASQGLLTTTVRSTSANAGISRMSGDKPILLTSGYAVDLDSQESDWGAKRIADASGHDLRYAGAVFAPKDIAPATAAATLEDCMRAGYRGYIDVDDLITDAAFCVKTTSGAFARMVIIAKEDGQLTLDVVVWQKRA